MQLQINDRLKADKSKKILEITENYLKTAVYPQAESIDRDPLALKNAFQGMGDRNLLALRVLPKWGGAGVDEITFRHFQMLVARYSGALAFLQTQHQSAVAQLAASFNESLKNTYLPRMGNGGTCLGVGYSQLRRQGEPMMKATAVAGGYQLDGEVPWITGYGFFEAFIIGAILPDGRGIYGLVPLENARQASGGEISLSQPMQLAVMTSTNTVSARVKNWLLDREDIVNITPAGAIGESDRKNVLHHGFFALGCAQAGLDIVGKAYQKKELAFIQRAYDVLNEELSQCQQEMFESIVVTTHSFEQQLKLRAWAINLAGRCSQAAVTVTSGAANFRSHPAQRVYREALMFTVSGQTREVMEATLERLTLEI